MYTRMQERASRNIACSYLNYSGNTSRNISEKQLNGGQVAMAEGGDAGAVAGEGRREGREEEREMMEIMSLGKQRRDGFENMGHM